MYSSRIPIAVDLSDGLVEGENTLKITLEGGNTEFADKNLLICVQINSFKQWLVVLRGLDIWSITP